MGFKNRQFNRPVYEEQSAEPDEIMDNLGSNIGDLIRAILALD